MYCLAEDHEHQNSLATQVIAGYLNESIILQKEGKWKFVNEIKKIHTENRRIFYHVLFGECTNIHYFISLWQCNLI